MTTDLPSVGDVPDYGEPWPSELDRLEWERAVAAALAGLTTLLEVDAGEGPYTDLTWTWTAKDHDAAVTYAQLFIEEDGTWTEAYLAGRAQAGGGGSAAQWTLDAGGTPGDTDWYTALSLVAADGGQLDWFGDSGGARLVLVAATGQTSDPLLNVANVFAVSPDGTIGTVDPGGLDAPVLAYGGGVWRATELADLTEGPTTNQQAGDWTLDPATDAGNRLALTTGDPHVVTIPADDIGAVWPLGTNIDLIRVGAGTVTVVAAMGVTLHATPSATLRAQGSAARLEQINPDEWVLTGDLTAESPFLADYLQARSTATFDGETSGASSFAAWDTVDHAAASVSVNADTTKIDVNEDGIYAVLVSFHVDADTGGQTISDIRATITGAPILVSARAQVSGGSAQEGRFYSFSGFIAQGTQLRLELLVQTSGGGTWSSLSFPPNVFVQRLA